jgi:hypothetical protein
MRSIFLMKTTRILAVAACLMLTACMGRFTLNTAREVFASADDEDNPTIHNGDYCVNLDRAPPVETRAAYEALVQQGLLQCAGEPWTCEPTPNSKSYIIVRIRKIKVFEEVSQESSLSVVAYKVRLEAMKRTNPVKIEGGELMNAELVARTEVQPFYAKYRALFDAIHPVQGGDCVSKDCAIVATFKRYDKQQRWLLYGVHDGTFD